MHRSLASPLHAARPGAAASFCLALATAALVIAHPLVLAALLVAGLVAAAGAGVLGPVGRAARFAVPLGVVVVLLNALIDRNGLTVWLRLGEVPGYGQVDLTLEALAYGGVLALRILVVVLAGALLSAAVDPDGLLRLLRRIGTHSAMTAVLAVRLVPVLARDGARLEEARHLRAGVGGDGSARGPSRVTLLRAVTAGALDRAVDVAATLEVRGYGSGARLPAGSGPWSRHDVAFAAATTVLLAATVLARLAGHASFSASPVLAAPTGAAELALCAVVLLCAGLPFLERRGIAR